jgi:pimeloyl-ACP methyl ester carboxylesterase
MESPEIAHHYTNPGLGLPLVGERIAVCPEEIFFRRWQPFAVTAVLRPVADTAATSACSEHVLELYNPLAFETLDWGGVPCPLARDLTAPLAAIVNEVPRQYLRGFTAPSDTSVKPQLLLLEPYQRGKIPVVFIHGLYSDPITWVDMINELRAQSDLYDQFQFWTFRYPTGGEMLESAAVLRQRLLLARETFDPQHTDPALDAMMLIGHSLGGLVSEMQITSSYDLLWRAVALQPFSALRASPEMQERLARDFFFEPVPMVKRVIFIGTPHRGSGIARRLAGCVGNALISFGSTEDEDYRQLIDQNCGLFKPAVQRHRPTTIDLLDPDSPFLQALAEMPINCATRLHSIIGTGGCSPSEPGDGVVPVASARHCGDSELLVPAKHEKLHRHPASIAEVARILRLHAVEMDQAIAGGVAR